MVFISPCDILAIAGVSGNPSELFARAATGLVRFVQKLGTSKLQWFIMVHHGSSFLLFEDHHFWGMPWSVCHGITNFCQSHVWFRFHLAVVSLKPGALHVRPGSKHRCDPQNSCRSGCQQSCAESESVHHSSQFSTQIRHLENTLMLLYVVVVFRYAMAAMDSIQELVDSLWQGQDSCMELLQSTVALLQAPGASAKSR